MKQKDCYLKNRLRRIGGENLGDMDLLMAELESFSIGGELLNGQIETLKSRLALGEEELDLILLSFVDRFLGGRLLGPLRDLEDLVQSIPNATKINIPRQALSLCFTPRMSLRDSIYYFLLGEDFIPQTLVKLNETSLAESSCDVVQKIFSLARQAKSVTIVTHDILLTKSWLSSENIFELNSSDFDAEELCLFKKLNNCFVISSASGATQKPASSVVDIRIVNPSRAVRSESMQDEFIFVDSEFPPISNDRLWERECERLSIPVTKRDLHKIQSVFPYRLSQIRKIFEEAKVEKRETWNYEALASLCRKQNSVQLESFTRKIESRYSWDDLVLPPSSILRLKEAERFILTKGQRKNISRRHSRGQGVSLIFEGPSGTGKTMAAEVLAGSLGLDLYQVNLSRLTSQYVGETEKNLTEVFRAAENAAGILFFDEGESLFSKRSQGSSVQDKYSNLEVNHLLQELESFEGIVIISTNLGENIDSAFMRRINFELRFPRPNLKAREKIWRLHLEKDCERIENIEFNFLAGLPLTGGFIKNVVSQASSAALFEDRALQMSDILHAVKREYQKVKWPIQRENFGDQYWKIVSPDWEDSYARRRLKEWGV